MVSISYVRTFLQNVNLKIFKSLKCIKYIVSCHYSEGAEERAVRNIKPRCNEGSIRWRNPNGGLRIELQAGYSSNFRACFAIDTTNVAVKVSQESRLTSGKHTSGYLHTVAIAVNRTKEICIPSSSSSVLLYLETERLPYQSGVQKVTFHYVIEPRSNTLFFNPMEEGKLDMFVVISWMTLCRCVYFVCI